MNINFSYELEQAKPKIMEVLKTYLPKTPTRFAKIVAEYPNRQGQYIRPTLLLLTYRMAGFTDSMAALSAAALQVSHDWLVAHDDVEDQATKRRGKPSINTLYGDALAINAGDSLHLIMWRMLMDNTQNLGPELGQKISRKIQEMLYETTLGQFHELDWIQNNNFTVNLNDYFQMVDKKTGRYSITGPIQLGAILARRNDWLAAIKRFTEPWGRAFQVQNDISNLKNIRSGEANDITEGKRSLPFLHMFGESSQNDRKEIKRIYMKNPEEKTMEEIDFILALIKNHDSLAYAQKIVDKMAIQAKSKLTISELKPLFGALEHTMPLSRPSL